MTDDLGPQDPAPQRRTLTLEGLGFRGEAYARVEEGFVSVWHALPGDVIEADVGPQRRGRAWAEPVRWLHRSADHRDPECHHYARCSGCALRHISHDHEQRWKRDAMRQILGRYGPPGAGDLPIDWVDAGARIGHRTRGRFQVERGGDGAWRLGLRSVALDRDLVDVRDCSAQAPAFRALMRRAGDALDTLGDAGAAIASVEIHLGHGGAARVAWHLHAERLTLPQHARHALAAVFASDPALTAGVVDADGHWQPLSGHPEGALTLDLGARVEAPWGSWSHATPDVARLLVRWVLDRFSDLLDGTQTALDLCCGLGTVTFALAPHVARLVAVDEDHRAVRAVQSAALRAGLTHIQGRPGRLGAILRKLQREQLRPAAAVINPMRRPLGAKQLDGLSALGVRRIVYLGPSAVSAARDAATLADQGFTLHRAAAINLHPATAQCMLAMELRADAPDAPRV